MSSTVLPLLFAAVVLLTFVVLMIDLTVNNNRRSTISEHEEHFPHS
jgi:hypothetical protein